MVSASGPVPCEPGRSIVSPLAHPASNRACRWFNVTVRLITAVRVSQWGKYVVRGRGRSPHHNQRTPPLHPCGGPETNSRSSS